jgi:hypothetical protein
VNNKVYTHEFIDILGAKRPQYMHHMTANWSPIAQEERNQLCFGVWGVIGTTDRWPRVINMWEEDGFAGLAAGLGHETGRPNLQDAKLEKWWNEAAGYRSGGFDRVMIPAPWTRTITELNAAGVSGAVYAHEFVKLAPGTAQDFLELVRTDMVPAYEAAGLQLISAMRTSMIDDSECILIWAYPSWDAWTSFEAAYNSKPEPGRAEPLEASAAEGLRDWQQKLYSRSQEFRRFLMLDAPLCPLKIGRQPARSDRVDNWDEG